MQEMRCLEIDVLGLSEVRWIDTGSFDKQGYHITWSGGQNHEHGVGFILNSKSKISYKGHLAVSNRIILLKLKSQKIDVNLIHVNAPTMDSNENAIQEFYKDRDATKKKCKSGEMLLVMGDWNAIIGCSVEQPMVDGYDLGSRNERGDLLVDWCRENSIVVTNTWFKNHPRRLYTWRSPGNLTRNQIDYILSSKKFRNSILNCKTYPQADCNTDHILLVATLRLKLKTCTKPKMTLKKDYSIYKQKEIIKNIHNKTETALLRQQVRDNNNVNECYELLKQETTIAEEEVPLLPKKEQESWMTPEIKDLLKREKIAQNMTQLNTRTLIN